MTILERTHYVDTFATVPLFADWNTAYLLSFAQEAPITQYAQGTLVYSPEDPTERLFVLAEGQVSRYHLSAEGAMVVTAKLLPGALFGDMALVGEAMHGHFAEALSECVVYELSQADVQRWLLDDTQVAQSLLRMMGERVIDLEFQLQIITLKDVPQRVAATLLFVSDKLGGSRELPCRHEDIAHFINSTRATVTKVLNTLQESGVIALRRGHITLHDKDALRVAAGD